MQGLMFLKKSNLLHTASSLWPPLQDVTATRSAAILRIQRPEQQLCAVLFHGITPSRTLLIGRPFRVQHDHVPLPIQHVLAAQKDSRGNAHRSPDPELSVGMKLPFQASQRAQGWLRNLHFPALPAYDLTIHAPTPDQRINLRSEHVKFRRQLPAPVVHIRVHGCGSSMRHLRLHRDLARAWIDGNPLRSEEHTSELQSQSNLVCRLL